MNANLLIDPISLFVDKLSSEGNLNVKIRSIFDNLFVNISAKPLFFKFTFSVNVKKLVVPTFKKSSLVFLNRRSSNFRIEKQTQLSLKLKQIPIYTVVNRYNEVILSSPRISKQKSFLESLQTAYNELFDWEKDMGSVSIGLFFMNKEDAAIYLQETCKKNPKDAEKLGLRVTVVGLDVFYKLTRTCLPSLQTKLVADLKEIEEVLMTHIYKPSCVVHPKQKYSAKWFQGVPVYLTTLHSDSRQKVVFFCQKDAVKAWKTCVENRSQIYSEKKPYVEVYSLENLLLDVENEEKHAVHNFTFVPPAGFHHVISYAPSLKKASVCIALEKLLFGLRLNLNSLRNFFKGILWLMTSDALPNEENSW